MGDRERRETTQTGIFRGGQPSYRAWKDGEVRGGNVSRELLERYSPECRRVNISCREEC